MDNEFQSKSGKLYQEMSRENNDDSFKNEDYSEKEYDEAPFEKSQDEELKIVLIQTQQDN